MSQKDTRDRDAIYKDTEITRFLTMSLQRGDEIRPKYDLEYGYRYPEVEKSINKDPIKTKEFLEKLVDLGVLKQKLVNMTLHCPSCNSANILTNYVCPSCGYPQISRNALIEHMPCGHIDNITNFRVNGNLICPKCKVQLGNAEYRSAGSWYECPKCGKPVETPKTLHICRKCSENFTFDDAKYVEVYGYSIVPTVIAEIKNRALFYSFLRPFRANLKVNLKVPGRITGKSGVRYEFDALLKMKGSKVIAIDTLISNLPISHTAITKEYGKILDTNVEAYIVASPSLSKDAKKLAKTYGLNTIEGPPADALKKLRKALPIKLTGKKEGAAKMSDLSSSERVDEISEVMAPSRKKKSENQKLIHVRDDLINELLDIAKRENKTLYAIVNDIFESTIHRHTYASRTVKAPSSEEISEVMAPSRKKKSENQKLIHVSDDLINELLDIAKRENKTLYAIVNDIFESTIHRHTYASRTVKAPSSEENSKNNRYNQGQNDRML